MVMDTGFLEKIAKVSERPQPCHDSQGLITYIVLLCCFRYFVESLRATGLLISNKMCLVKKKKGRKGQISFCKFSNQFLFINAHRRLSLL